MNKVMFAGLAFAAVLAVNTGSGFAAASVNVKACAAQWQQMKAANSVPAGTTWPSFEKDCVAKLDASAAPAAPAAAAPAVKVAAPAAPAAPAAKIAAPAVAVPAVAASPSAMAAANDKNCTDQWAAMSTLKKMASGNTADTFKAACLAKLQAAAPAAPAAKMVAPAAAVTPAVKGAAPAAAATGGMPAEQSRIKICAKQWDDMKAAKTTPVNLKWPQFWHECDVKLKAAGQ